MIKRLGRDVVSQVRSGVALTSISQCVEELVLNSLDAGSTCITIDVDICCASVEVSDNGTGMRQCDLKSMGNRYFTSKCHSLSDLENAGSYGFRGEAVASLSKTCEKLEIISRHKTSYRTFCKLARRGRDMGVYESASPRSRHGTTVSAHGIFHSLPVRRKLLSSTLDLERIRRKIAAIAIMHPTVSLILRNKEKGCIYLQTRRSLSVLSMISQVFGCYKSQAFKSVSKTFGSFKLSGYVNLEGFPNKNFQFFYLNKRLVLKTKFHKLANHILSKGIPQLQTDNLVSVTQQGNLTSPKSKTGDKYAGFVINLECPHNVYDITFDPAKTLVEFENWDDPLRCLTLCLNDFLVNEGVLTEEVSDNPGNYIPLDIQNDSENVQQMETDSRNTNLNPKSDGDPVHKRTSIHPSDLKQCLCSATAKRKQDIEAVDNQTGRKSSKSTPEDGPNQSNKHKIINKSSCGKGIESSPGSSGHNKVQSNFPFLSAAGEKATDSALSTLSFSQESTAKIPSPQKHLKPQQYKKSSIYTVLQKFCHNPHNNNNNNPLFSKSGSTEPYHSDKHSSNHGSNWDSSKFRHSQRTKFQIMGCRRVSKRSTLQSLRNRTFGRHGGQKNSRINSLLRKEGNQTLISKGEQVILSKPEGGVCSNMWKVKNSDRNTEHSQESETYSESEVSQELCQLDGFRQINNQKMSSTPGGDNAEDGTIIKISDSVNRDVNYASTEGCQCESKVVNNSQTVTHQVVDSPGTDGGPRPINYSPVDKSGTRGHFTTGHDCRITGDSRIMKDTRSEDNPQAGGDSRAVDDVMAKYETQTEGDSSMLNKCSPANSYSIMSDSGSIGNCVSVGDSRTVGDTSILSDSRTVHNSETPSDSQMMVKPNTMYNSKAVGNFDKSTDDCVTGSSSGTVCNSRAPANPIMVVDSGILGNPEREIRCEQDISHNSESTWDLYEVPRKRFDGMEDRTTSVEDKNIDKCPGRLAARDPGGEINVGDDRVNSDNNGVRVINSNSNSGGTAGSHSEWICQYDFWQGRQMFVNVRTGNTSLENPTYQADSAKMLPNSERSGQTQTLHPFASHLSHNFTPWLPRNKNQTSKSGEIPEETCQRNMDQFQNGSGEIDVMFDGWVNPVFEGNGKVG